MLGITKAKIAEAENVTSAKFTNATTSQKDTSPAEAFSAPAAVSTYVPEKASTTTAIDLLPPVTKATSATTANLRPSFSFFTSTLSVEGKTDLASISNLAISTIGDFFVTTSDFALEEDRNVKLNSDFNALTTGVWASSSDNGSPTSKTATANAESSSDRATSLLTAANAIEERTIIANSVSLPDSASAFEATKEQSASNFFLTPADVNYSTFTANQLLSSPSFAALSPKAKQVPASQDETEIIGILNTARNDPLSLVATAEDLLPFAMASLSPEIAESAGYNVSEVIMRCVYNGVKCTTSDFRLKLDPNYGNCFTFNADSMHMTAPRVGASTGLSVTYFVGEDQYLDFVQTSGVRIVVHLQNEPIFPDVMGIDAPSGYQSAASMSRVQIKGLSTSANPCVESPTDVPTYNYNTSYATEACLRSCYQEYVIGKCNCADPRVPLPRDARVQFCNVAKRECVNDYYDVGNVTKACYCPNGCDRNSFAVTQTASKWPLFREMNQAINLDRTVSTGDRNQLVKIDVYYEDLTIVEYSENWPYDFPSLAYDVSSILGLFTGMSIMSLFEVIILVHYLKRKLCPVH